MRNSCLHVLPVCPERPQMGRVKLGKSLAVPTSGVTTSCRRRPTATMIASIYVMIKMVALLSLTKKAQTPVGSRTLPLVHLNQAVRQVTHLQR